MPNVGSAYVTLMPSMDGFAAGVNKGISGIDTSQSGKAMGAKTAKGFAGGFASGGIVIGAAAAIANKAMAAVSGSMSRAISRVDTMRNFPKVMVNLGYSAEDAARNIQAMSDGLDGLPTSLDAMVSMVQQLTPLSSSMDEATQIGLAFNNMLLSGGADMQQQQSALLQYTQALAKGKPELQDWRTLQQVMPGQLDQTAKALLGTSAKSMDLYDALKSGKVSMNDFNQAILRLNTEGANGFASFEQQARDATTGIQTAMDNMATRTAKGVATLIDAIGQENISGAINYLSSGIGGIANNLAGDLSVATGFIVDHREQIAGLVDDMTALVPAATRAYGAVLLFKGARGIFNGVSGGIGSMTGKVNDFGERVFMQGVKMEQGGKLAQKGAKGFQTIGNAMNSMSTGQMVGATAAIAGLVIVGAKFGQMFAENAEHEKRFRDATVGMTSAVNDIIGATGGAAAGIDQLGDAAKNATTPIMDFSQRQSEHVQNIINTRDKLNEQVGSLDAARATIEKYAGATDLTTQEQGKLRSAIETVNGSCGTQYKVVDAANGAISDSKGNYDAAKAAAGEYKNEIYEVIEAKKQEARVEAAKNALTDAYGAQQAAVEGYTAAVAHLNEVQTSKRDAEALGLDTSGFDAEIAAATRGVEEWSRQVDDADKVVAGLEGNLGLVSQGAQGANAAFNSFASESGFGQMLAQRGKDVNDFSKRMDEMGISVETLSSLSQEQLATMAVGFDGSGQSIVATLAGMGIAIDGYNAKSLKNIHANVTLDDDELADAQGNVYTWNGTELLDKHGNAVAEDKQLVDANGQVWTWNHTSMQWKNTGVNVNTAQMDSAQTKWKNMSFGARIAEVLVQYGHKNAAGGFVKTHASGGFLTSGVTGLGMDRDGNYHIAGEDGVEWIKYHADGTTSVVPIENRKYLEPYASVIASMIPRQGNTTTNNIRVVLQYDASSNSKDMARGITRALKMEGLMR